MPALTDIVREAGYESTRIDFADLCDPARLTAPRFDLLVLPDASALPVKAAPAIDAYLRTGGDVLALRAPLWQTPLVFIDGQWQSVLDYRLAHAADPPPNVLARFEPGDVERWQHWSSDPSPAAVPHRRTIEVPAVLLAPASIRAPTTITLRLHATDRGPFGEAFRLTLSPQQDVAGGSSNRP